jgi:3-oxoacyl-[acyl-carrier protein] reductase
MCEEKGAKTLLFRADVSDDDAVKRMLAAVDATFGRLDALANNAGITSEVGPKDFDAMTADEWDRVFAVNVRGLFQVTRASIPMLKAARVT